MDPEVVTVVSNYGEQKKVSWYQGTTTDTITACIRLAFGVPLEDEISLVLSSGETFDPHQTGGVLDSTTTVHLNVTRHSSAHREGQDETEPREGGNNDVIPWSETDHEKHKDDDAERPLLGVKHQQLGREGTQNPRSARRDWVYLKRILTHLANERTYLAWVRVEAKMFAVGVTSLGIAAKTGGKYSFFLVAMGMVYISLCPTVVFLGHKRFEQAENCIVDRLTNTPELLANRDVMLMTVLLALLTGLSISITALEVFSDLSY
ncbi:unnamed protein product [Discosporangium mesarthrocarpum]